MQRMRRALVIGNSGGIGRALAGALQESGVEVTGLSRSEHGFDVTDPASVEAGMAGLSPGFDMILVASGALTVVAPRPEKSLAELTAEEMAAQFAVNAIGPALVLRHVPRLLRRDGRGVVAVLSARVGSIGDNRMGGWYSYRAAKAAVNQIVHGAAIELTRSHREAICVALHPGTVATESTKAYAGRQKLAPSESATHLLGVLDGLTPDDSGGFFAWDGERIEW
jgi:NAD(P)-dependent dehydrogenase (short-subunit alcohol dehydrogenase family)